MTSISAVATLIWQKFRVSHQSANIFSQKSVSKYSVNSYFTFQCRKEGHLAADCEEPDKCRFCGEEGHKAGDCTGAKTHEVTKEDGTKHEIYIPSEVNVVAL